ncbi:hypothetical protein C6497_07735 [Candidatus Poribacteria bacterium]|nr:MAG: hypothetical protein C6497_07735 [Candidatus Poribacteria bacterium]
MKNNIYLFILSINISLFLINSSIGSIITDGLVSYWTFDNEHIVDKTAKDVWGDNNGKINGNPKLVNGKVGEALEFDGAKDFINLTTLGDFGRKMGTSTFEAWIKTKNNNDWMNLVNTHGIECPFWGIQLNGLKSKDAFRRGRGMMFFINSVERKRACSAYFIGNNINFYDGEWHHIVYINELNLEDGKTKEFVYIDSIAHGSIHGSFGNDWITLQFTEPVHLGVSNFEGKTEGFFEGMIDEVRFYDRSLKLEEIRHNYESTAPFNVEPNGKLPTVWGALKKKF